MSNGTSEAELSLVSERKIDDIGVLLSVGNLSEDEFYDAISLGASTVYRCPKCSRLHIEVGEGVFQSYIKEVV
ncbi:hypothetical protein I4I80_25580 [Pseudomonas syringae pv. tomato]|nr:hypothetical protein [Pseudomonas syringae group genomosp. 3]MBF9247382.1 hypothetical protein [Pseudomonas syringae pv. tomato]MBM0210160.1 hypothetical protein [Pseudomonas syringae pv. maculicola]MBW8024234.1 hypothetical protein [Pseudomonas syringae pv. tomato]